MLGFFPRLYKDELLYSWFARYHLYSANDGPKQTMEDLFGIQNELAVPDLPVNLERLFPQIRQFRVSDPIVWIEHHTFFAFYTAFILPEFRDKVKNSMLESNGNQALHMLTGVMASSISEKSVFYYCPMCFDEEFRTNGEGYWHVLHQLPGVLVCTKHGILLSKTKVTFRPKNRHEFIAAKRENCPPVSPVNAYSEKTLQHLFTVAHEIEDLMTNQYVFGREILENAYRNLLRKNGFLSAKGRVYQNSLVEVFQRFYGNECLEILQSSVKKDNESCWLRAISRKHRHSFHPVRHILFIHFLGSSLSSLFQETDHTFYPFGQAPYLCLNRAADHYMQPMIQEVQVTRCTDTGRPVGTFTCSCGFIYSRRGPDQNEKDRLKIGRIKRFGDIWMKRLHELVATKRMSYRAIARELGVDTNTVIKYANYIEKNSRDSTIDNSILTSKQSEWLMLVETHSEMYVTEIRELNYALYAWLYRNCHDWLIQHSPKQEKPLIKNERIDWEERDQQMVIDVQKAIAILMQQVPLVRVTKHRIATEIHKRGLIQTNLEKMPNTKGLIERSVETVEQFQIRRVYYVANFLANSQDQIMDWQIRRLAGLRNHLDPQVEAAISHVIQEYNSAGRMSI